MSLTWHNEKRKVCDLLEMPENPRQLTKEQAKNLEASFKKFDLVEIPVIDTDNTLIAGHQRMKIMQLLGRANEEIDVRVPNRKLTDTERKEYNLRSNKNTGEWDNDKLAQYFDEEMLKDVGFTEDEIAEALQKTIEGEEDDFDTTPPEEPKTKLGDIFILGDHVLMCGDSTKKEDVEKLMGGEKADMVFTDPPYGVGYENKVKMLGSENYSKISGDFDIESATAVWEPAFKNIANVLNQNGGSYYVCSPQGGDQMMMMMMMMMKGSIPCRHELIWAKPSPVFSMGRLDYDYKHEPILYGWIGSHDFIGGGKYTKSIWEIGRESDGSHPTMKPVELCANAIQNSSKSDGLVLDLFGGSGSTLIACEQTGRKCRMMELDPKYCDVIIARWEKLTGKTAEKRLDY